MFLDGGETNTFGISIITKTKYPYMMNSTHPIEVLYSPSAGSGISNVNVTWVSDDTAACTWTVPYSPSASGMCFWFFSYRGGKQKESMLHWSSSFNF